MDLGCGGGGIPYGLSFFPAIEMKNNYGGLERQFSSYENSRAAVIPVPFEESSSWVKGSVRGPDAIIEASAHMELYDIETDSEVYRRGIYTCEPVKEKGAESMVGKVRELNLKFLTKGIFPVTLGGEHTVSLGAIKAASDVFKDISIIQLDAHTDLRDSYEGSPYSHACVMARVREFNSNIFPVGIRSMDASEKALLDPDKTVFAHQAVKGNEWEKKILKQLGRDVFLDIDLDVFDPSVISSTGTPEPGGLTWRQVNDFILNISRSSRIRGISLSELCPSPRSRVSDFTAAKLIYRILSIVMEQPGRPE